MSQTAPDVVRNSCCTYASRHVHINEEKLRHFALQTLSWSNIAQHTNADTNSFPELKFETLIDEAGFITLAHALDFGSGFRVALHHRRNGQGAWLTIRAGLVQIGKLSTCLSSSFLQSFTLESVSRLFDIDGVDALRPLGEGIVQVLHELGRGLQETGTSSLGHCVFHWLEKDCVGVEANTPIPSLQHLSQGKSLPQAQSITPQRGRASGLVSKLVSLFPLTFKDEYVMSDGSFVAFYKKAQLVVSELYARFHATEPMFNFIDFDRLTAFVDNVVVACLRKEGVLECSEELSEKLARNAPLCRGSEEEVGLRAAALCAVERCCSMANTVGGGAAMIEKGDEANSRVSVCPAQLCNYLWGYYGKLPEIRKFPRHYTPDTIFY